VNNFNLTRIVLLCLSMINFSCRDATEEKSKEARVRVIVSEFENGVYELDGNRIESDKLIDYLEKNQEISNIKYISNTKRIDLTQEKVLKFLRKIEDAGRVVIEWEFVEGDSTSDEDVPNNDDGGNDDPF
jgi:hypothetical protein